MIRPASVLRAVLVSAAVSLGLPAAGLAASSPGWNASERLSSEGVAGGQGRAATTEAGRTAATWIEQDGDGDRRLFARVREANGTWGSIDPISGWSSNLGTDPMLTANGDGSFTLLWYGELRSLRAASGHHLHMGTR